MPLLRGFGLKEACRLALDIGKLRQTQDDLPSFRPSREEKPYVLLAEASIDAYKVDYNGVVLAVGKVAVLAMRLIV
jgi:hypothetical protein